MAQHQQQGIKTQVHNLASNSCLSVIRVSKRTGCEKMSTIIQSSKSENDTAPLVSLEGVHVKLTSLKQEQCSPTSDLSLLTYTSAPVHPLAQEMSLHSASNSWEGEHLGVSRRNSEGAAKSHLRSHLHVYQSGTSAGDQPLPTSPRHAQYERIPSARMVGRRHHLMLKRGEKGPVELPILAAPSTKGGQKYQRLVDDGAAECEKEQEVEDEECTERGSEEDRVSVSKKRRSWSGSLPSAFTFAPYQSF